MDFEWEEIWSYIIGFIGMLLHKIPMITCEGVTVFFAMLIVIVTFFFITIPTAVQKNKKNKVE